MAFIRQQRHGFTLIELLVVIGVIALLLSILLPSLTMAKKQAQSVVCMTRQKQLALALNLYVQDYKGQIYCGGDWVFLLAPYVGLDSVKKVDSKADHYVDPGRVLEVGLCPSSKRNPLPPGIDPINDNSNGEVQKNWRWNGLEGSFEINGFVIRAAASAYTDMMGWKNEFFWTQNLETVSAEVPFCSDSVLWCGFPMNTDLPPTTLQGDLRAYRPEKDYQMMRRCIARHKGGVNVAFIGGQVEKVPFPDLWTLKWHKGAAPNFNVEVPSK